MVDLSQQHTCDGPEKSQEARRSGDEVGVRYTDRIKRSPDLLQSSGAAPKQQGQGTDVQLLNFLVRYILHSKTSHSQANRGATNFVAYSP